MDSLQILVVESPFANMTSLYEVDHDADVLLIVPPFAQSSPNSTTPGLRLKVSSKHLTLSSKPFKNKLQFKKSSQIQSDGRVHISLTPGFDPKAVTVVLNAVHGRGSKVPKNADLDTLAKIAFFVDKFQFYESLEIYADRWISTLWKSTSASVDELSEKALTQWIYISHVFKQAEIFKQTTRQIALVASGPINTHGLPIRDKIIKHIDAQRQEIVGKSLHIIHSAVQDLLNETASKCDTHLCDNFLLGDLIKTLHRSGHTSIWPEPAKPFTGASYAGIVKAIGGTSIQLDRFRLGASLWDNSAARKTNGVIANRKRKSPNAGVGKPITPDSSPEPVSRTGLNGTSGLPRIDNGHDCAARRVFARLDGIEDLEDGVKGLNLESSLGYQLY
ncbi:hypothetical protein QBC37DRAFT_378051 [Rhypophila decipiens]|uniref:Uncharacterized protein n=1 Tax=Rhypophila decipiens TaxID=261697 RepID=A0AAN6XZE4_9PEZI|nr:hypothetical protein QBC37DRAFT_378051 [Rhypophila decipiens]